jgi:hypothetical protein
MRDGLPYAGRGKLLTIDNDSSCIVHYIGSSIRGLPFKPTWHVVSEDCCFNCRRIQ